MYIMHSPWMQSAQGRYWRKWWHSATAPTNCVAEIKRVLMHPRSTPQDRKSTWRPLLSIKQLALYPPSTNFTQISLTLNMTYPANSLGENPQNTCRTPNLLSPTIIYPMTLAITCPTCLKSIQCLDYTATLASRTTTPSGKTRFDICG